MGRVKDMIIRGGINIYPSEIEDLLCSHPSIIDAAAVPWPSPELGEEIAVFITKKNSISSSDVIEYCKKSLAPYKIPKDVFFLDDLPKSAQGKILKSELSKLLLNSVISGVS